MTKGKFLLVSLLLPLAAIGQSKETILHTFNQDEAPFLSGLLPGVDGAFYGTTATGGQYDLGTAFRFSKTPTGWSYQTIFDFAGPNGDQPETTLISDSTGNLYGVTGKGSGCNGCGVVFKLSPPACPTCGWTETVLHTFTSFSDGLFPEGPLYLDHSGNLFGTTESGGSCSTCVVGGTVYELTPPDGGTVLGPWTKTTLFNFPGGNIGEWPMGGVIPTAPGVDTEAEPAGALYGVNFEGNKTGNGNLYRLTPPAQPGGEWTQRIISKFDDDGGQAVAAPFMDSSGRFFGAAHHAVYEVDPPHNGAPWTLSLLRVFETNDPAGYYTYSGLVSDPSGALYGGTLYGPVPSTECNGFGCGGVFKLSPPADAGLPWTETVLHAFHGTNGAGPGGNSMVLGVSPDGGFILFGETMAGGANGDGVIFELH